MGIKIREKLKIEFYFLTILFGRMNTELNKLEEDLKKVEQRFKEIVEYKTIRAIIISAIFAAIVTMMSLYLFVCICRTYGPEYNYECESIRRCLYPPYHHTCWCDGHYILVKGWKRPLTFLDRFTPKKFK